MVLAAGLAACTPAEESSSLPGEESSQLALENDGATTQLVVAEISHSPERTAALEEIAAKYMADFPQTRVEIVTVEDSQEALAMLEGGQADLVELSQQEQPGAVEQGLLVDLEPYLDVWEERSSLTMAAKASMWVEPHFSLMLTPSGSALMTSVRSLEKRSNRRAAVAEAAPLAQSTRMRRPPRVESMVDSRWSM